ncbi:MAG: hypothetical protein ABFS32_06725 [Bacteroidota bacterium]
MSKTAKVFWISFGVYSILLLFGAITIERNAYNLNFLFKAKEYISLLKYFTFIGLAFFVVAFVSSWRCRISHNKTIKRLEDQKTELKANLFDLKKKGDVSPPDQGIDSPEPME